MMIDPTSLIISSHTFGLLCLRFFNELSISTMPPFLKSKSQQKCAFICSTTNCLSCGCRMIVCLNYNAPSALRINQNGQDIQDFIWCNINLLVSCIIKEPSCFYALNPTGHSSSNTWFSLLYRWPVAPMEPDSHLCVSCANYSRVNPTVHSRERRSVCHGSIK